MPPRLPPPVRAGPSSPARRYGGPTARSCGAHGADRFVHLRGDPALLRDRLDQRSGHFATADLRDSQLATLEPPEPGADVLVLDVAEPVDRLVARIQLWVAAAGFQAQGV